MELEATINNKIFYITDYNSDSNVYTVKLAWSDGKTFVIRDNYQPRVYLLVKETGLKKVIKGSRTGYNTFEFVIDTSVLSSNISSGWFILDVSIELEDGSRLIANPDKSIEIFVRK